MTEREKSIEEMRSKLEDLMNTFTAEDFWRVTTKFFSSLMITEEHFRRRFPAEHALWEKEYYGDD